MSDIRKHAREFLRAIRNKRVEQTPEGVLFSDQHLFLRGELGIRNITIDEPWEYNHNLVTVQGVNYFFESALRGGTGYSHYYFVPYAANTAPVNTLTAANFNSSQTEFTNYTEGARQECVFGAASAGATNNTATAATITIGSSGQTAIYGFGIASASAKSAATGIMLACAALAAGRTGLQAADQYGLKYALSGSST